MGHAIVLTIQCPHAAARIIHRSVAAVQPAQSGPTSRPAQFILFQATEDSAARLTEATIPDTAEWEASGEALVVTVGATEDTGAELEATEEASLLAMAEDTVGWEATAADLHRELVDTAEAWEDTVGASVATAWEDTAAELEASVEATVADSHRELVVELAAECMAAPVSDHPIAQA
jgi:hypothetical protein